MKTAICIAAIIIAALAGFAPHAVRAQGAQRSSSQASPQISPQASIAAVVNGDPITMQDVRMRMRLIMSSSGMPDTPEMRQKVTPQIVNMLIEETLIAQEAKRDGVSVSRADLDAAFEGLAEQNKFTPDQFKEVLAHSGIPRAALDAQLRSQIAWSKVIQKKIRPRIEISDNQVDARLKKLNDSLGTEEYLIAEIFLPVDNAQADANVKQLADKITGQLSTGKVPFHAVATQFSQSASASRGGDVGWVQGPQLPTQVEEVVKQMKPGELSKPIRTLTGYSIVLLREKRAITAETMPSRDDIRQEIGMSMLDRMQRRYLLNLKSSAFIDRRAS
jgi:peptidyl-prolyl cis-trans isomerase SurA